MQALSRFYLRNQQRLVSDAPTHWINLPADCDWLSLINPQRGDLLSVQDFGQAQSLQRAGAPVEFCAFPSQSKRRWSSVVLTIPREKALLEMMTQLCASLLDKDGTAWFAGENRAGAKSAGKRIEAVFSSVQKVDSARHCTLWRARNPVQTEPFIPGHHEQVWTTEIMTGALAPLKFKTHSWPGTFSHGSLDNGTELLLQTLTVPGAGARVLDFACGAGVIGTALLLKQDALDVIMSDVSALACLSAQRTLESHGLNAEVVASDGFSMLEGRFDCIISNPPFHTGHRQNMRLTPSLMAPVRRYLAPGGRLQLVANRHLPYSDWLEAEFGSVRCLNSNSQFQVLQCTNR